jgi:hypothetical protein
MTRNTIKTLGMLLVIAMAALTVAQAADMYTKHKGDKRRGEATDDMALVYFFRPATMGAAIKTWGFVDDQLVGVSKAKGYYFAPVPAGKHIVWSKAENTSAVEVDLKAGETYYFKQGIRMGFNKARVETMQIDATEAEKYFKKCSFCEVSEEGRTRGAEIAANRMERAEKNVEKKAAKKRKKADKKKSSD